MSNERDTRFQGFAKLLFAELDDKFQSSYVIIDSSGSPEGNQQDMQTLIAQRAYDLVAHALDVAFRCLPNPTDVEDIPDVEAFIDTGGIG